MEIHYILKNVGLFLFVRLVKIRTKFVNRMKIFLFVLLVKICTKFVIRVKIWFLLICLVGGNLY